MREDTRRRWQVAAFLTLSHGVWTPAHRSVVVLYPVGFLCITFFSCSWWPTAVPTAGAAGSPEVSGNFSSSSRRRGMQQTRRVFVLHRLFTLSLRHFVLELSTPKESWFCVFG